MSEEEVMKLWLETGCVPVEYVEALYERRFSTADPFPQLTKPEEKQ